MGLGPLGTSWASSSNSLRANEEGDGDGDDDVDFLGLKVVDMWLEGELGSKSRVWVDPEMDLDLEEVLSWSEGRAKTTRKRKRKIKERNLRDGCANFELRN